MLSFTLIDLSDGLHARELPRIEWRVPSATSESLLFDDSPPGFEPSASPVAAPTASRPDDLLKPSRNARMAGVFAIPVGFGLMVCGGVPWVIVDANGGAGHPWWEIAVAGIGGMVAAPAIVGIGGLRGRHTLKVNGIHVGSANGTASVILWGTAIAGWYASAVATSNGCGSRNLAEDWCDVPMFVAPVVPYGLAMVFGLAQHAANSRAGAAGVASDAIPGAPGSPVQVSLAPWISDDRRGFAVVGTF